MNTISSSSDKQYFSRLLNLIGSVKKNNIQGYYFEVWDLGLTKFQRWLLNRNGVTVNRVEQFSSHWNQCYSWKPYVYLKSESSLFFHLDAGNTVLKDISHIFESIKDNGYFLIDQGQKICDITPPDYFNMFGKNTNLNDTVFAAGNIGLNKSDPRLIRCINNAFQASKEGYCLGFSPSEMYRDTFGLNITRNCKIFRHDQTIINLVLRNEIPNIYIHSHLKYANIMEDSEATIYNNRGYKYQYIKHFNDRYFLFIISYCFIFDLYFRVLKKIKGLLGV